MLLVRSRERNRNGIDVIAVQGWLSAPRVIAAEINCTEKVEGKSWMVASKVSDVKGRVVRPEVLSTIMNPPERCSTSSNHYTGPTSERRVMKPILACRSHDWDRSRPT